MKRVFGFFLVLVFLILAISCSSEKKSIKLEFPLKPSITFLKDANEGIIGIQFTARSKEEHKILSSINELKINVFEKDKLLQELYIYNFMIQALKTGEDSEVAVMYNKVVWPIPEDFSLEKYHIECYYPIDSSKFFHFEYLRDIDITTQRIDKPSDNCFVLDGSYEFKSDSSITFSLVARRISKKEEYFPSSEQLRIKIYSKKGELLWSSDYKQNFLQVIGNVLPEELTEKHKYQIEWDGNKNNGEKLKPGVYKIKYILPTKPEEHVFESTFEMQ